jgi:hypothetical protein
LVRGAWVGGNLEKRLHDRVAWVLQIRQLQVRHLDDGRVLGAGLEDDIGGGEDAKPGKSAEVAESVALIVWSCYAAMAASCSDRWSPARLQRE